MDGDSPRLDTSILASRHQNLNRKSFETRKKHEESARHSPMALAKEVTKDLTKKYGKSEKDTGSTEVQVALLSTRIKELTEHLKSNAKDFSCQRGLMMLVGKRRRLLDYYKENHTPEEYKELISSLKIRK
jgi:small subunit ribosomal protein S15